MAHPARHHPDEQLSRLGRIELELLDRERLPEFMEDGRLDLGRHGAYTPPSTIRRSSVISRIVYAGPSLVLPDALVPPYGI